MSVETGDFEAPLTPAPSRMSIESIEKIVELVIPVLAWIGAAGGLTRHQLCAYSRAVQIGQQGAFKKSTWILDRV